jgi:hypothetical protein
LRELDSTIKEELMTTFDAWHTKFSDQMELLEGHAGILDNYKNIVDLVGKDKLGLDKAIMKDMREASMEIANSNLIAAKAQKEYTEESLKTA